ncbi:hypothetical protein Leryth_021584 [Lithospermum erythrorhizon]|nr:hypothetical protein Leryth_021584 [Lithospermum erythrorhizon]
MGADKKGVGGFFQLFDWNTKSRKKLFSSKSDLAEKSKQKKSCDGNSPVTRLQLMDEGDIAGSSSIKGSSDYSCASSVTDEDNWGTKAPGVVAKLMGLNSLPTCNSDLYATPFSDSHSLGDFNYRSGNLECCHEEIMLSGTVHKREARTRSMIEQKYQKPINRPIEKFQTEMLPPKSAKSIPITHHKLLSPIKSSSFSSSNDVAHIMEAAARIIEPRPQITTKTKMSLVGSSSIPLRVKDLREKAEAVEKQARLAEVYQRPGESNASKYLNGQPTNKSWSGGSAVPTSIMSSSGSEEYSTGVKNKGKSVSLALQAKENVRKREGMRSTGSKNVDVQKESCNSKSSKIFKSQPSNSRSAQKKPPANNSSSVLRQNNQKQNCSSEIGKPSSKQFTSNSQGSSGSGESVLLRRKISNKSAGSSRIGPRRLGTDVSNDRRDGPYSNTKNVSRKKRCINGDFQFERSPLSKTMSIDKSGSLIQSNSPMDGQISGSEEHKRSATEIVSFTFTAPMTRSIHGTETSRDFEGVGADYQNKRGLLRSDVVSSSLGKTHYRSDDLNTLLEQKLRELNSISESPQQKERKAGTSSSVYPHFMTDASTLNSLTVLQSQPLQDMKQKETPISNWGSLSSPTYFQCIPLKHGRYGMDGETDSYHSNSSTVTKQLLDSRLPSPVSVLEPSFFSESCNSTDTVDSNCIGSKLCSSVQAQEVLGVTSLKRLHPAEGDAELSDSASSTLARKYITTSSVVISRQPANWEMVYVKEILCHLEPMFDALTMGRVQNVISPLMFDQLEGQSEVASSCCSEPRLKRKVLFDCVGECLDLRCRKYAGCGYNSWAKGHSVVRRKERLAQEVYHEITSWSGMGHCMVDELVDNDMSSKFGRWDDYECEAFELGMQIEKSLLNSLIDEVVADMLVF